jgi:hypothetical protein
VARIRSIKPGFFSNEHLAELSFAHRLCFAGLWTLADREGRLEDRPRRIKAALFPYDEVDVDALLNGLAGKDFVTRYVADGVPYLEIPTFSQHQRPKLDETPSVIPAAVLGAPRGKVTAPRSYNGHRNGQGTEGESADGALPAAADALQEAWNRLTKPPIARCRDLTTKRRRQGKSRLTERPLTEWEVVFSRIQASTFCCGSNDRGWVASFDWVVGSPDVAVKVLEGKYDDRKPQPTPSQAGWVCTHTPHCLGRHECHTLTSLGR